jgi:hypothetical protein
VRGGGLGGVLEAELLSWMHLQHESHLSHNDFCPIYSL